MFGTLDFGLSGPGSSPGRDHYVELSGHLMDYLLHYKNT